MANMYLMSIIFCLTLALVQCVQSTCTSCTSPKVCKWTCNISATAIPDADLSACTAENTACGPASQSGQCKSTCGTATVQPTCNSCTSPNVCKWTCNISATAIPDADLSVCTTENTACGPASQKGQCKSTCGTATVQPTCTSCTSPKVCKWTCNKTASAIPDADLTVCAAENTACGPTSKKGQCKSMCVIATDTIPTDSPSATEAPTGQKDSPSVTVAPTGQTGKNGSIKCGLSPLIMICGALAMLFLRP